VSVSQVNSSPALVVQTKEIAKPESVYAAKTVDGENAEVKYNHQTKSVMVGTIIVMV